jgi:hypothetical protein
MQSAGVAEATTPGGEGEVAGVGGALPSWATPDGDGAGDTTAVGDGLARSPDPEGDAAGKEAAADSPGAADGHAVASGDGL